MPYDPKAIANYFLTVAAEHNESLDPMKIQKLVYFANGWHLAVKGAPLINEQVEAWPYGPVIPSLYAAFRRFGDQPITRRAEHTAIDYIDEHTLTDNSFEPSLDDIPDQAEFTKAFLDRIWELLAITQQSSCRMRRTGLARHGTSSSSTITARSPRERTFQLS